MLLAFVPAYILLALEIAASRIAPPAENHAVRKRLIGIYLLIIIPALALMIPNAKGLYGVSLLLLAVVIIDALAEPEEGLRAVCRPFQGLGKVGRALSLFFTPGWASASWYVLLVAGLGAAILYSQSRLDDAVEVLEYVSYLGALIFPAALIRLLSPSTRYFLAFYIGLHALFVADDISCGNDCRNLQRANYAKWICPIPNCALLLRFYDQIAGQQARDSLGLTGLVTAASLGVLLARAMTPLRESAQRTVGKATS